MIIEKNKKGTNKYFIIRVLILIIIFILVIVTILWNIKRVEKNKIIQEIKNYTSIEQFKSIEEVAIYMDCEYIKEEKSKTEQYYKDIYLTIPCKPFTNTESNQQYYEKLMTICAKVMNYESYIIIDKQQELILSVKCNKEKQAITNYYVNEEINYFQNKMSQINIQEYKPVEQIKLDIQAKELIQLLSEDWNSKDSIFGTRDSIYKNYSIFFDEGISIRKVDGKIFNIVFDKKYIKPVVNNITTSTTNKEIEEILGIPQMRNELANIIGYKTQDIYIFFSENEISIYSATSEHKTTEFAKLVEKYSLDKNLVEFIADLKNIWTDYDIYKYDSNYVYIQYSLKGVSIKFNYENKNGIYIYNNFKGNISGNLTLNQIIDEEEKTPDNIYIENKDLVLQAEFLRIQDKKHINYDVFNIIKNVSEEYTIDISNADTGIYIVNFISKNENYPNRELKEYITSGAWQDQENFIYSVSGKGIYKYNVRTNTYTTLKKGKDNFNIKSFKDGILQYDNTSIKL